MSARCCAECGVAALAAVSALSALSALSAAALLPLHAERLLASVGGYAVMNCHLDFPFGNEIPYHLQWDKDGESIFSWYSGDGEPVIADRWGGRVRRVVGAGLGGGTINVSAVRETDVGLYRCRVTFPNRTPPARNNGTFYYLDVEGGNVIVTPPMNVTVLEGERAELECRPRAAQATVQWYRGGLALQRLPELAARCDLPANGSLVIRAASSTDPAEYECRVQAPDGGTQSSSAYLDVQYQAKVVYAPKERYLPLGKPASLDCHFSANPPLTNLRWEKDGFLFDPYNVPGVFYSRNGSLLFNQVDESHEGEYSCTAYNSLGSAGASPGVRVRVVRPPVLRARPQPLYLARLGSVLTLPCAPATLPHSINPLLTWTRKDGKPLPEGRHSLEGGNLTLSEIAASDAGVYECTASNDAAATRARAELLVENVPPRAPHRLAASPAHNNIHLSWLPGHNGMEVEYTVWYRPRDESEWRTMRILSRDVTDATLDALRSGTEYEIRVLAQDHIGDGLFSKPLFVKTLALEEEEPDAEAAVAVTEAMEATTNAGEAGEQGEGTGEPLDVTVRLVEEGALVRWSRTADRSRCTMRWLEGEQRRLVSTTHTQQDYVLVGAVAEGELYAARVWCGSGARGAASVRVPQYARLRVVAGACAGAALLLAALAAALLLARRRLRAHKDKRRR